MRCWQCGVEPLETVDVSTLSTAQPLYIAGRWPASDDGHQHRVTPPTPGQLEQAGHDTLSRIQAEGLAP